MVKKIKNIKKKNDGRKNIFVLNVFNTAKENLKKNKKIKKNKQKMTDEKIFFVLNVFNSAKKRKKSKRSFV